MTTRHGEPGPTIPAALVNSFLDVWGDLELADEVATSLTCTEADTLAELFTALGAADTAQAWIDAHAVADDGGDAHFRPEGATSE